MVRRFDAIWFHYSEVMKNFAPYICNVFKSGIVDLGKISFLEGSLTLITDRLD
jgi:hypothetical protein